MLYKKVDNIFRYFLKNIEFSKIFYKDQERGRNFITTIGQEFIKKCKAMFSGI